ncbi:arsR-family transcriptional regulator (plasmid) [Pseudovibrio sp. FO-BEG1]|uniref:Transcriptional regulator, ArsR family n=2 Tax=Pseudovibrio TaxID=258255 RepID=A0A1I7D2W7_9HYPH|nr:MULTISPECIES: metalloregulator ArsR/SmtB family transcription factor [Pseudovibrio]AEV39600.1 arsR-family transcriptional regulator [Pseudovibrio sp. FO-BEG1]QUS58698.1 winged helix-turn-helix transcriptional regulator [Pseudovibrio brasiliensis]WNZ53771.1 metalloregulator ArsR/SmtB family transcription factor [Microbulbifer sp. MKSA007]SFU06052.1 transcriptional regulator, ArsR family [Pseudovibrio denitrificans]
MSLIEILKTLANENRLTILEWLQDPVAHFPPQKNGDLIEHGVCLGAIARKLGISQPTATNHMKVLVNAGLVTPTRNSNWVYFRLNKEAVSLFLDDLQNKVATQK